MANVKNSSIKNKRKSNTSSLSKNLKIILFVYFVISILLFFGVIFFGNSFVNFINNRSFLNTLNFNNGLKIEVIDVNQGDAIYISLPDGKNMLIDSGDNKDKKSTEKFISYIETNFKNNSNVLDYCILTHPDADHAGNMDFVFDYFDVKVAYRPFVFSPAVEEVISGAKTVTTKTYQNYVSKLLAENCKIIVNEAGEVIEGENYKFTFYSPNNTKYSKTNNYSPIIVLEYFGKRFCLTGDAEELAEKEVLDTIPFCDVLKAGHHGSSTSSSQAFLNAVLPKYVMVSVGANNNYSHPSQDFVNRINNLSSVQKVLYTKDVGTISCFVNEDLAKKDIIYFYDESGITLEEVVIIVYGCLFLICIVNLSLVAKKVKKSTKI